MEMWEIRKGQPVHLAPGVRVLKVVDISEMKGDRRYADREVDCLGNCLGSHKDDLAFLIGKRLSRAKKHGRPGTMTLWPGDGDHRLFRAGHLVCPCCGHEISKEAGDATT